MPLALLVGHVSSADVEDSASTFALSHAGHLLASPVLPCSMNWNRSLQPALKLLFTSVSWLLCPPRPVMVLAFIMHVLGDHRGVVQGNMMEQHERHAVLMLDEIRLTPGLAYDPSSGAVNGRPTIPLADGSFPKDALATHALVFMLGGVTTRWKQTVAYEFTGNSFSAAAAKKVIVTILTECEKMGLVVDAIVSDMGGGNQGLWKEFGIVVGRYSKHAVSCPHPCDQSRKLYFMADVPHLLKNLRNYLPYGQAIFLPDDIVKKHRLPSAEVNLSYVEKLVMEDSKLNLKLAPHLKEACLGQGHFEKMKAGLAFSLFNHDTAAGLRNLVQIGKLKKKALTTASFFEVV
ncbi:hypothetical protein HPB48_006021 [Haemaphysalis longicornis]|uniref:Transposable element P transposase-like RNase H domain-containing protein n=1 Tax=Haemaphysalis longicornis TaxID=44386 RepID=A0A9J6FKW3_HAELO|nr:hypothetical protein HPB48_006021 [Haemaphysalis longicornis]